MTASCQSTQQWIDECQGLVRSLAMGIHRKLPPYVELDDLVAYGQVGLAQAAHDFDPSRGSRFSTYAYYRIRGAIYDGLAKMSWFSRAQYRQVRSERAANEILCADGEAADPASPVGQQHDLRWFRAISRTLAVVYLSTQCDDADVADGEELADASSPDPLHAAHRREVSQKLHELVDALPEEEATLVRSTYFDGLSLQETADRLRISKSWASRLQAKALRQLARSLTLLGVTNC